VRIDVVSIFPEYLAPLELSLPGKARERGLLDLHVHDLRDWAHDRHRTVDDTPYGGGAGMVMKPEPLVKAIEAAKQRRPSARVILMSPQGARFDQARAQALVRDGELILVCGRYEGVDERVLGWIDEELSVGDFVLTGGELAALAVIDAAARLVPGVLGNDLSPQSESFAGEGLLEGPQYTRPPEFRGLKVPEVLLSGDHAKIAQWRREQALSRTRERRPDLLKIT